jgi:hypothetical protein
MNPIVKALYGDEPLPAPEEIILKKILQDNFLTLKAQELMVQCFAEGAIKMMLPLERTAMKRRFGPVAESGPAYEIRWSFSEGLNAPFIKAALVRAGHEVESVQFDQPPDSFTWRGSTVPAHVLQRYHAAYKPRLPMPPEFYVAAIGKSASEIADAKASQSTLDRQRRLKEESA